MILIHRITPFAIGLCSVLGFVAIFLKLIHPLLGLTVTALLVVFLFSRLLKWNAKSFQFWHFLGTPTLYLIASFGMIFLFEQPLFGIILSIFTVLFLVLFSEFVFQYIHLPSQYQPYSIEYLTLLLNVLTIFFLSSVGFGMNLLIQTPLWILALFFFLVSFFILYSTLWVSKAEESRFFPYAFAGSILTTEFFVSLAFLPSGLYTNAALITLFFYLFLGLTRAETQHKLSTSVIRRYLITVGILLLAIIASTQWI